MGIFSQEDVVVGTAFTPLIEDQPNFIEQAVEAIYKFNVSFTEAYTTNLNEGIIRAVNSLHNNAKHNTEYGLIESSTSAYFINKDAVQEAIEDLTGFELNTLNVFLDYPNADFISQDYLHHTYQLNYTTGLLEDTTTFTTNSLVKVGYLSAAFSEDIGEEEEILNVLVGLQFDYPRGVSSSKSYIYSLEFNKNKLYYHARYTTLTEPDKIRSILIGINNPTYPDIDPAVDSDASEYLPAVPIVQNRFYLSDFSEGSLEAQEALVTEKIVQDSEMLLKKIGLDLSEVSESIKESDTENTLRSAYLVFAIDIARNDPSALKYLYLFLSFLYDQTIYSKTDFTNSDLGEVINLYKFTDESNFNHELSYNWMDKQILSGVIGKVGTVTSTYTERPDLVSGSGLYRITRADSYFILEKQITENTFERLTVAGLSSKTKVFRYRGRDYYAEQDVNTVQITDEDGYKEGGLYIPVNYTILRTMTATERREVLISSMGVVYYVANIYKRKWYETDLFKAIVFIVSAIFYSYELISLIEAYGVVVGLAIAVGLQVIISIAVDLAVEALIDIFGEDIGKMFLVIAAIIILIYGFGSDNLKNMVYADELLAMMSPILSGLNNYYIDETNSILSDQAELLEAAETRQEELEEAYSYITNDSKYDPLFVQQANTIHLFNESPSAFYTRTVHTGNIGTEVLNFASDYVTNALRLPTIDETFNRG